MEWTDELAEGYTKPSQPRFTMTVQKDIDVDRKERTFVGVIATESVDRDREVINIKGVDLEAWQANPVILFAHDHRNVIGKGLWVKRRRKGGVPQLLAKGQMAETELGEEVFQLMAGEFLRGFSVGLARPEDPRKESIRQVTPADVRKNPEMANAERIIENSEMLEFSVVGIPANREALSTAVKSGMVKCCKPWLEPYIRQLDRPRKVTVILPKRAKPKPKVVRVVNVIEPGNNPVTDAGGLVKLIRRAEAYEAGRI